MSTWTFDRRRIRIFLALTMVAGLTACGGSRFGPTTSSAPKQSIISVSGKSIIIEGPPGFCVDDKVSQTGGDTAFVLLGNCKVVAPSFRAKAPKVKALLTATVSGANQNAASVAQSVDSMDRFFRSETGRTALSRASDPGTVRVLETFQNNSTFFLRASDTSEGVVPDAADDYWRAYFDLHGQIVSVSVIGFKSDPITPETGLDTLREFAFLIQDRNGVVATPVVAAAVPVTQEATQSDTQVASTTKKSGGFWKIGLLRKLFN